jgi:hypothetical protein
MGLEHRLVGVQRYRHESIELGLWIEHGALGIERGRDESIELGLWIEHRAMGVKFRRVAEQRPDQLDVRQRRPSARTGRERSRQLRLDGL